MAQILPYLVGDKIPDDDLNYVCFLKLLEIPRIALSLSVSHDTVAYLVILIEEHHTMFTKQYPNESILPILHYMVITHDKLYPTVP